MRGARQVNCASLNIWLAPAMMHKIDKDIPDGSRLPLPLGYLKMSIKRRSSLIILLIISDHLPSYMFSSCRNCQHNPVCLLQIGLLIRLNHELMNDHKIGIGYSTKWLQTETRC